MTLRRDLFEQYQAFGFLVLRRLFSPAEAADLQNQFDAIIRVGETDETGIGRGTEEASAALRQQLAADERIQEVAESLLGDEYQFISMACTSYAADSPWHANSNIIQWALRLVKIAIYLDPLDARSGCLRVIPCSHRNSLRLLDPRWALAPDPLFGIRNRDVV